MTAPETRRMHREVAPLELFFDLVFVFAVSQLTHHLIEHLTWRGAAQTAVALIAVAPSVPVTVAGLFFLGAFSAPMTVWAQTLRMQILPAELHGRAFALLRLIMQAGNPLGAAFSGVLFPLLGVAGLIAASAAVMGLPGAVGLAIRNLRRAAR